MKARSVVVASILLAVTACSAASDASGSQIGVTLEEFSIDVTESDWAAGPISLDVDNRGEFSHTVVVTSDTGTVIETSPVLAPGDATTLELDLDPGTYHLTCRIVAETPDGELVDHYEHGMHAAVVVG
jgi:iron uptake system component EfeO